jgi:hypothetical protein
MRGLSLDALALMRLWTEEVRIQMELPLSPNDAHEPREAAASGSRIQSERNGCLPLAQCVG